MPAVLGIDKLVTSVTMTVFYVLLYYIWLGRFREEEKRGMTLALLGLTILRVALCLFPGNGWLENSSDMTRGILRNIPFVLIGAAVCRLYYRTRKKDRLFRPVWLYILLSFLFYIPVAVGAGAVPMLGMLQNSIPSKPCQTFFPL